MHRREAKPSDKKPILPRPLFVKSHEARPNPDNWKWRLVLLLTGGQIEVVPRLPLRPIHAREVLVVRLGVEGALNTVEVKMPKVTELVPVDHTLLAPDTFVALDVDLHFRPDKRIVGTVGQVFDGDVVIIDPDTGDPTTVARTSIKQAYWAPMGYRP